MRVAVCVPVLLSAVVGLLVPRVVDRIRPDAAVVAATVAAVGCALTTVVCLGLLAVTWVGQLPLVAGPAHWPVQVLDAHDPVTPAEAGAALLVLGVLAVALGRTVRADLRAARAVRRFCRSQDGPGTLVVLDGVAPLALAVPGRRPRVVVSAGLLGALNATERRVLLAHEHAHLARRHHLYLTLVAVAATLNPLLRPVKPAVGYAAERWADEDAAAAVGDRPLAARALAHAALATVRARPEPTLRLFAAGFVRDSVPRRVRALRAPAPSRRGRVLAAVLAGLLLLAAGAATGVAAHEVERLFEAAMHPAVASSHGPVPSHPA